MTNSILLALLNGAIVSTLIGVAVWIGLRLTPRSMLGAAARYLVWWTALAAVVLLPVAYFRTAPPAPVERDGPRTTQPMKGSPPAVSPLAMAPTTLPPQNSATPAKPLFPIRLAAGARSGWVLIVWAASSALLLLRLAMSCLLLERRKNGALPAPPHLADRIAAWLSRPVSVLASRRIATPVLAGLRHPAILIPSRLLAELTDEELEQIAVHEAAHLARRDDYALLAQRAVEAMLPLHPVARWIARQIELEREIACDDLVVERTGGARKYAVCLTRVVELCGGVRGAWVGAGVGGDRSQLARRVEMLIDRHRGTRPPAGKLRLAGMISLVVALAVLAGRTPSAIALSAAAPPAVADRLVVVDAPPLPEAEQAPVHTPVQAVTPTHEPVMVAVSVEDLDNRSVAGLTKESFQVSEDGVEQQISDVSAENIPLSVGIVVDISGSMRDKQPLVDAALTQLLKSANTLDEFFVVTANDGANVSGGFIGQPAQVLSQAHWEQPHGGTALRDGIARALQWENARYPQKMLVVVSDGDDNASSVRTDDLRDAVQAAKIPIWAITLSSADGYPRHRPAWLQDIAEQSHGHEFILNDGVQAAQAAGSIANQVIYGLKYQSTNTAIDGKFRRIDVRVVTAPSGSYRVRHRAGYYAGGRL